jgi:hypothetical protein
VFYQEIHPIHYTFQYIVDTIDTSQQGKKLKRLQLKDRSGKVTTFYSYLDEDKTSSAPVAPSNPGMGTTRAPEFQRQYEEAVKDYDLTHPSLPTRSGITGRADCRRAHPFRHKQSGRLRQVDC